MTIAKAAILAFLPGLLAGCASTRVASPADDIAKAVAAFQADLSVFQKSVQLRQANLIALAAGNDVSRAVFARDLEQIRMEQSLAATPGFDQALKNLQLQADSRIAAVISPSNTAPAPSLASLPVGKLGEVTTIVQQIAKPPSRGEKLKSLADFAKSTNDDLAALAKEKKKPE